MSGAQVFHAAGPEATLLVPLWCRAQCELIYPSLGVGAADAELLRSFRADFSQARRADCALYALRELLMKSAAEKYLAAHPRAAIVDLGCGLDTLPRRLGSGGNRRYYVDLPDVIALRERLLPPQATEEYIPADLRCPDFLDRIGAEHGAVFLMGGLLCHLEDMEWRALLSELASRFAMCMAAFDGIGRVALSLGAQRGGFKSYLPVKSAMYRTFGFGSLEAVTRLPAVFESVPVGERIKLRVLLKTGVIRFYEAGFAGMREERRA